MSAANNLGLAAVARLAGVSRATVSNAINRPEVVAPRTRSKIEAAIQELNFVPNRAAAALRQGKSTLLGLVVPDIVNPFYAAIADAVSDAADRHGYTVALCVSHDDPEKELRQLDTLAQQRIAGALVTPISADSSRLANLRRVGSRLVLVDRTADPHDCCSVAVDDKLGGDLATQHLLDAPGFGISLVNGLKTIPQCADRRTGARRAIEGRGLDPDSLVEYETEEMTVESGVRIGHRIAEESAPRRIFCINDQLASGVIRGLAEAGLRTPQDVLVVGYGDLALPMDGGATLTTIGQPKQRMGETAVSQLLAELREGDAHRHSCIQFEPHLVVRASTRTAD